MGKPVVFVGASLITRDSVTRLADLLDVVDARLVVVPGMVAPVDDVWWLIEEAGLSERLTAPTGLSGDLTGVLLADDEPGVPAGITKVLVDGGEGLQDRHVYRALQALGVPRAKAYMLTCPPIDDRPGDAETLRLMGELINRRRG